MSKTKILPNIPKPRYSGRYRGFNLSLHMLFRRLKHAANRDRHNPQTLMLSHHYHSTAQTNPTQPSTLNSPSQCRHIHIATHKHHIKHTNNVNTNTTTSHTTNNKIHNQHNTHTHNTQTHTQTEQTADTTAATKHKNKTHFTNHKYKYTLFKWHTIIQQVNQFYFALHLSVSQIKRANYS